MYVRMHRSPCVLPFLPISLFSRHYIILRELNIIFIVIVTNITNNITSSSSSSGSSSSGTNVFYKYGVSDVNPYPTAFPYGNGMVLHFYQQQESSTTKTIHKVINKGLKAYV